MRKEIVVNYEGKKCYEITLNGGFESLISDMHQAIGDDNSKKVCIVSDSQVAEIFLNKITDLFYGHFSKVISFVFESGERSKNMDTVQKLYEQLIINKFDRHDLLVALGGGVVGDLTGFGAATYLRGIDFIQIPTSLLAQVDSSIGGKTGVDFQQYKNMVGAFYQPKLVYMSMEVFQSLPDNQFANGMAEEIKHGLIKDGAYYTWMKDNRELICQKSPETLIGMLDIGCNIKRVVVENDPKEKGERALLNFGHTIGHAIEKLSDFQLYHGECVSLGMVAAAYLSVKKGHLTPEDLADIEQVLSSYALPIRISGYDPMEILETTKSDKKMIGGKVKFTLLKRIGEAYSDLSLTDEDLLEAIHYVLE
ncbi:MAG: 3-dehydroquinate synthase [bacterium]|nr:3-dehydroquinate synthase [bacterium]MDY4099072.1 3-dehydroquinate synthase [Lachnospiraceae bacterium]